MSEDEEELDRQDDFEAKYNFRFQEDGSNDVCLCFPCQFRPFPTTLS